MERILVVEDDRAVQRALKRLFETEKFAVEISSDGKSALEAFRREIPSAVVLDLRLPALSGRDVCLPSWAQTGRDRRIGPLSAVSRTLADIPGAHDPSHSVDVQL